MKQLRKILSIKTKLNDFSLFFPLNLLCNSHGLNASVINTFYSPTILSRIFKLQSSHILLAFILFFCKKSILRCFYLKIPLVYFLNITFNLAIILI